MKRLGRLVVMILAPFATLLYFPLSTWGTPSSTAIVHSPVTSSRSGDRIPVKATITDPTGVESARTYFKALEAPDYAFVAMVPSPDGTFVSTLPAPAKGAQAVDYLILVRNGANQVVTSQSFRIAVEDSDAIAAENGPMPVYTELAKAPEGLPGFTGNIALSKVEPDAKFGLVAGLYSSAATGGGASADEGGDTTSGGTVVASSKNWEMIGVIGGSAAVAVALAVGSSGGGGDGGGGSGGGGGGGSTGINDQPTTCYGYYNTPDLDLCQTQTIQFQSTVICSEPSTFPDYDSQGFAADWYSATPSNCPGGFGAHCVFDRAFEHGTYVHEVFFYRGNVSYAGEICSSMGGTLQ